MRLLAPAKINPFLAVGPPDALGYHPLRTIFQAVGLYDEIEIEPGSGVEFVGQTVPPENTVTKALRLARELRPDLPEIAVRITKNIPSPGGLGGGSSDAATVLKALPLTPEERFKVAKWVGADCPFFLLGGRARGEGYGELLTPLPDPEPHWLVLAKPDVACPTPEMYRKLDALPREWREWGEAPYNDFERVAPCECLDLIDGLASFEAPAGLCGSGATVWGRFASREAADRAAGRLDAPFIAVAQALCR
ncbi:4-(cytidine 5'-diphospho)-2-C-methyl-D-erythritol kinase [soil metagenome]